MASEAPKPGEITGPEIALCTVCDWPYLPQLLVMARTLRTAWHSGPLSHSGPLHVVCLDEGTRRYLETCPGIVPIPVAELELGDPAVAATRRSRSRREYAWTLKPAACMHVLRIRGDAEAVGFVDADLMFFGSLDPIFSELTRGSVLLVPERAVAPGAWSAAGVRGELGRAQGATMGFYSSGMIVFRRDLDGLAALGWWRERCIESCQESIAAGRYGDQWYLNALPELFDGVRVIEHPGVGLAPWNARARKLALIRGELTADAQPAVFHHFQSLRLRRDTVTARLAGWCSNDLGALPGVAPALRATIARYWRISAVERELLWQPYLRELATAVADVVDAEPAWAVTVDPAPAEELARDVSGELRWRSYQAAGRILPPRARSAASVARARARDRSGRRARDAECP